MAQKMEPGVAWGRGLGGAGGGEPVQGAPIIGPDPGAETWLGLPQMSG